MDRGDAKKRRAGHGGGEEDGAEEAPDLISRLPDCVLGTIVSLLDTKEGARTAALSHRWRQTWRSAPLNFDDYLGCIKNNRRLEIIPHILAAHPGPARRLAFSWLCLRANARLYDAWFRLPLFDALQELVLQFPSGYHELPASALRFASLRVLDLTNCTFPAGCSPAFPCLTYLSLHHVHATEELLQGMISSSPGIETMVLRTNFGHRRLRFSLPRLRYLAVSVKLDDLVVEDAASLERLMLREVTHGPSVRIIGATKLNMLGYLGTGIPTFELGNSIFKGMVAISLEEQFSTVRILALEMPEPNLKVVTDYLRCFPCLEKLHIKFFVHNGRSLEGAGFCDPFAPIECLDRSLKTIVLRYYAGLKPYVEFAKFFVERARVLELMKFGSNRGCATRWLQSQRRRLNLENRASRRARFHFVVEGTFHFSFWMSEAFSRDDPFAKEGGL